MTYHNFWDYDIRPWRRLNNLDGTKWIYHTELLNDRIALAADISPHKLRVTVSELRTALKLYPRNQPKRISDIP